MLELTVLDQWQDLMILDIFSNINDLIILLHPVTDQCRSFSEVNLLLINELIAWDLLDLLNLLCIHSQNR